MTKEMLSNITGLLTDEEALREITASIDTDEIIAAFAANGLSVTESDVLELAQGVVTLESNDELTEEALADVTGGSITLGAIGLWTAKLLGSIAIALIVKWGWNVAEKKLGLDLNGDGKIGC